MSHSNVSISFSVDSQPQLMKFDPQDGTITPYPSHAGQYREWHGQAAWLYDPWSGNKRSPMDIGTDTLGRAIDSRGSVLTTKG